MKRNTRIYNKWQGYYGGKRKGKIICLTENCVCEDEIREAADRERRERKIYGS